MSIPAFVFQRPTSTFLEGDPVGYAVTPAGELLDINVKRLSDGKVLDLRGVETFGNLEGEFFTPSHFVVEAKNQENTWKTQLTKFEVVSKDSSPHLLNGRRLQDAYTASISHVSARGVRTLSDPWALPYNCPPLPEHRTWFPTPCYEGQTSLVNEERRYYVDPLEYYGACLDLLLKKGVQFVTWHDLLDGWEPEIGKTAALIQFDIDAGIKSIRSVAKVLQDRNIPATAMVHQKARHWYEYDLSDDDIRFFATLEKESGWVIGYHNNALTNLVGKDGLEHYSDDLLDQAWQEFNKDISELKAHFNIRTFTHHGGNVINHKMGDEKAEGLACVDKRFAPELWSKIGTSYSDGGFQSRPVTLQKHCENFPEGLHFIRNHPFKYGNFDLEFCDAEPLGPHASNYENQGEIEKQTAWLETRFSGREDQILCYDSKDKPLSSQFISSERFEYHLKKFRGRRRESFLLDYPHSVSDPRVFWWKLLYSHAPKTGRLLNVGALPSAQKEEATAFLGEKVECMDMDIDAAREPDFVGDFVQWVADHNEQKFECVCLFGLPYFSDPKSAVEAVAHAITDDGVGLIGFCADTHPKRGAMWLPETRPLWKKGMIRDEILTIHGTLWSFSDQSVKELFEDVVGKVEVESVAHYWFVKVTK